LGFEDAQAGIEGIKGANMFAVGVSVGEPLHGADLIINSLEEIDLAKLV
jgi:beta-phosphoglucomutase